MSGRSGSYEKDTSSKATRPRTGASGGPSVTSGVCSSVSSSSSTRSREAMPDWKTFIIVASWVSGIVKVREYWMKAWTSPMVMAPEATRRPPTTATSPYWTLPRNMVSGCMRLDMNWAPNDDS